MPCRCTSIKSSSIFIETFRKFQGITKRYRAAFQKRTCNVVVLKTLGLQKCVKATMLKSNLIFRFFFFLRLWIDILNGIKITGIKQINIMIISFQKIVCYLVVWNNSYWLGIIVFQRRGVRRPLFGEICVIPLLCCFYLD